MNSKHCPTCNKTKDINEFGKSKNTKDKYTYQCKECQNIYQRQRNEIHPLDKEYASNYRLKRTYGITLEDKNRMVREQDNKCAICGIQSDSLAVDHNHNTGKIRELLCNGCNSGLGHFRENTITLKKAIEYLNKHKDIDGDLLDLLR